MTAPATGAALTERGPAIQALAGRWLEEVAKDPGVRLYGGDFACSPTGLWLALAAVASGAEGQTAEELGTLLGATGPALASAVTEVSRALTGSDAVAVATGVWAQTPIYRAFRETLPELGFGQLVSDRDGVIDTSEIDSWVGRQTGGLVERLPLDPNPDTLLLLVNALALTARWRRPFDAALTGPVGFTDAAGQEHRVDTMRGRLLPRDAWTVTVNTGAARRGGRAWGRAKHADRPEVTVVQLSCADSGDSGDGAAGGAPAVVRLLLGPPGAPAAAVLPAAWAAAPECSPVDTDVVYIELPRLSLHTQLDVGAQLGALGVQTPFSDSAQFPRLSPEPLKITQVVQQSLLRIAEKGVEAAAVTTVAMGRAGSARPAVQRTLRIAFNRPFGIVVLDPSGTVPLFTAWQASAPVGPNGDVAGG